MRNMSFALTKRQVLEGTKDVTRRLGWKFLKPGQRFRAVEKAMGLKPGEKIKALRVCECISNTPEPLCAITQSDVIREGFPELTPAGFIIMFISHMDAEPETIVNRIEFKYV